MHRGNKRFPNAQLEMAFDEGKLQGHTCWFSNPHDGCAVCSQFHARAARSAQ